MLFAYLDDMTGEDRSKETQEKMADEMRAITEKYDYKIRCIFDLEGMTAFCDYIRDMSKRFEK